MSYYWGSWRPYVPVAVRRNRAEAELQRLRKKGRPISPVTIEGRTIARSFWGKAWCENLERYSDYSNRLPRGRTYVRNGSVVDLQAATGVVEAFVSGSSLYKVTLTVSPLPRARWISICEDSAGAIDSLVELLQGRFSQGVMERICRQKTGLFPSPGEIKLACSCPDWASMCKHVAAVLYGVGARLDEQPELLFKLRKVDSKDLIVKAGEGLPLAKKGAASARVLKSDQLSEIFGLEMADVAPDAAEIKTAARSRNSKLGPKCKKSPATKTAKSSRAGSSRTAKLRDAMRGTKGAGAKGEATRGRSKTAVGKKGRAKR